MLYPQNFRHQNMYFPKLYPVRSFDFESKINIMFNTFFLPQAQFTDHFENLSNRENISEHLQYLPCMQSERYPQRRPTEYSHRPVPEAIVVANRKAEHPKLLSRRRDDDQQFKKWGETNGLHVLGKKMRHPKPTDHHEPQIVPPSNSDTRLSRNSYFSQKFREKKKCFVVVILQEKINKFCIYLFFCFINYGY